MLIVRQFRENSKRKLENCSCHVAKREREQRDGIEAATVAGVNKFAMRRADNKYERQLSLETTRGDL